MAKPRIAIVLPYLELGGTERHVSLLLQALGDRYAFLLAAPPGPGEAFLPPGTERLSFERFVRIRPAPGVASLAMAVRELRAWVRKPPALVHVHAAPEMLAACAAFLPGCARLFTIHGFQGASMRLNYRLAAWAGNRFAAHAICVSMAERDLLLTQGLHPDKLSVIYNGIPDNRYPPLTAGRSLGIESTAPVIGCVARLERAKGQEHLIRAVSILHQRGIEAQLVLIGKGADEERLRRIAAAYTGRYTIFAGQVDEAGPYFSLFDVFALPSVAEPQGIAAVEAMRAGLPVVASRVGGLAEVVKDGETGLLVPPGRPEPLADALARLLTDPLLARDLGCKGRERFLATFTVDRMAVKTAAIYDRLLAGHGR
ncbi:MAG: glycosyltransferase family 4 protein [Patescibacteria group bacterium]